MKYQVLNTVNAVDEAHNTTNNNNNSKDIPYNPTKKQKDLMKAHHILGTGQLSLAKYLFIIDEENAPDINDIKAFFIHLLKLIGTRDLHFLKKQQLIR